MSEIDVSRPAEVILDTKLARWAQDARQAHSVGVSLSRTAFVSSTLKGKPEEIAAAILTGQEIGLDPMSALRSIDIISGTPAMRANALRGLVQSRGHEVWVEEQTDRKAIVCGQRKGSEHVQRSTWTFERATQLGLTGKDNWRKQPSAMLVARATAEVCRLIASDVLLGLPYAVEELADDAPDKPVKVARKKPAAAEIEAPVLDEPTAEPIAEPDAPVMDWPDAAKPGAA